MNLKANKGAGLPFTIEPELESTTLLFNLTPLVYGSGTGLGVGPGAPKQNNFLQHFFTGRSDNFDLDRNSGDPRDARLDPESIRVSNDGLSVFVSDEYGPYVYQFLRFDGLRLRTFQLPEKFFVSTLSPMGNTEIANNTIGRVANKGMEGLAITPDGRTLVGIMQNALIQDASDGASKLLRIVTIDISPAAPPTSTPTSSPPARESATSSPSTTMSSSSTSVTARVSPMRPEKKPRSSRSSKSTFRARPTSAK